MRGWGWCSIGKTCKQSRAEERFKMHCGSCTGVQRERLYERGRGQGEKDGKDEGDGIV
jgi:hypothetical protein